MQIFFFLVLLNVSVVLLNVTSIFFVNPNPEFYGAGEDAKYGWNAWNGENVLVLLVLDFVAAMGVGWALARFGVNPYVTAAYLAFFGIFIFLYGLFVMVLNEIGNSMGEAKIIMTTFLTILTVVMAVLVLYTAIQMAVGGGKGFE